MIPCPLCKGTGIDCRIGSGKSIREGDTLMVREMPDWTYQPAVVVHFKSSGVKLQNDGDYTLKLASGKTEFFHNGDGRLFQCCARCGGAKAIEPTDLDRQILGSETQFFLSGGSTFRAALLEEDTWVKYRHPHLRGRSDLLTIGETVYKVHDTPIYQEAYQTFKVTKAGTIDVLADEPAECPTHGWFFPEETPDGRCPECVGGSGE